MKNIKTQILVSVSALVGLTILLVLIGDGDADNVLAFGAAMQWLPNIVGMLVAVPSAVVLLVSFLNSKNASRAFFSDRAKLATFAFLLGMSFLHWSGVVALVALIIAAYMESETNSESGDSQ